MSFRLATITNIQEALTFIRNTPLDHELLSLVLKDINELERSNRFTPWDIRDMRTVLLRKFYNNPNAVRERILAVIQSDNMHMREPLLLLVSECLLKQNL
jgi:hypothetical protein